MGFTIELAVFVVAILAFFMYIAYAHKNAYFAMAASALAFIFACMVWIGGIQEVSGSTITGTIGTAANFTQTAVYSNVNFGFSQNYIAMFFALLGLLMFFQALMAFVSPDGKLSQ